MRSTVEVFGLMHYYGRRRTCGAAAQKGCSADCVEQLKLSSKLLKDSDVV